MGPLGTDIDAVKRQIEQLKKFKAEVDPHMVKVEALNRSVLLLFHLFGVLVCFVYVNLQLYTNYVVSIVFGVGIFSVYYST